MDKVQQEARSETWDRLVRERVGEPLRPERIGSFLVVVPVASGDVALATTVVRHVKRINPGCRVRVATRRASVALAQMCPGVAETITMPPAPRSLDGHGWDAVSRRQFLSEYAGAAETVVCTCFFPEDTDLVTKYGLNALEAIWLLAGVAGGMPPGPHRVWLETPLSAPAASDILRRALGRQARWRLAERGVRRLPESLAAAAKFRSFQGTGITLVGRDLAGSVRNMVEMWRAIHEERLERAAFGREFVILSTEAVSVIGPPRGVTEALVRTLRQDGRTVLHNVLDPSRAAPGTVPLVCSYEEFVGLRQAGVPFVGWRSGLCDIAAASPAPMGVLYPPEHDWCRDPRTAFGLGTMGVADCLEMVCRNATDIRDSKLLNHLDQETYL